jgi:glucose-1-phosphate thymidylyltransferase
MKGILLAGGRGSRLFPITQSISKQLLPIYDKPMIYYPLSMLMLANIRDILIISTPDDISSYKKLLNDGSVIGLNISYEIQSEPRGLAEAFLIGEKFIGTDNVALILGDNLFYGQDLPRVLDSVRENLNGATIFGYPVKDASSFGVAEFDKEMNVISIEEKPSIPKSNFAIPGLYFYDNKVVNIAKRIKPSQRGELEITSVNQVYLEQKKLKVNLLGRGIAWLDTGTPSAMLDASHYVETIQKRQGFYISCIEEISWRKGWISTTELKMIGETMKNSDYGQYLLSLNK